MPDEIKKYSADDIDQTVRKKPTGENVQPNRKRIDAYVDFRTVNIYQFLRECEEGTGGFSGRTQTDCPSYIVPNITEPNYPTRVKRAVYINHYKKYIKAKYKDVFSLQTLVTSVKNGAGKVLEDHRYNIYTNNITGSGVDKNTFNKSVIRNSLRDAVSFIVCDKGPEDDNPYCYMKNAVEVALDSKGNPMYATDSKGALTSITFTEPTIEDSGGNKAEFRRTWSLDVFFKEMKYKGQDWKLVDGSASPNTLTYKGQKFLPVKPIIAQERNNIRDYMPYPDSFSIAAVVLGLYDRGSVMDYVIDVQGHSIPVINGDITSMPSGKYNALVYAEGDNKLNPPFYMSPDYHLPGVHGTRIKELTADMLDMMEEGGVTASLKSASPESGLAKAFTFSAKSSTSKETQKLVLECDKFEEKSYKVYMDEEKSDWVSVTSYPTSYVPAPDVPVSEVDTILKAVGESMPLTKASILKGLIRKINPQATPEELAPLFNEIDSKIEVTEQ